MVEIPGILRLEPPSFRFGTMSGTPGGGPYGARPYGAGSFGGANTTNNGNADNAEGMQQERREDLERYPGKRNGLPQQEVYIASPSFHATLSSFLSRLKAENATDILTQFSTVRDLAKLLYDVLAFLESAYGRHALSKPFPKLPYAVFRDVRPGGGIEILLKNVSHHIKTVTIPVHNRKKIDWTSPALRKELSELISHVRTELVRAGCIRQFKVYFESTGPNAIRNIEHLKEEKEMVVRLGGVVAGSGKERGVTHIVVANAKGMKDGREARGGGPVGNEPSDVEYFWRTVEKIGDEYSLVHWWYLPDSYNEYVPAMSAPAEIDADELPPNGRPWVVHERWVVDSDTYNEWMNEGDYETEESSEENKRVREAGKGGGTAVGGHNEPQRKKTKKELRVEEAAAEVGGVGGSNGRVVRVLAPGVVEREVKVVDRKTIEAVHVPTIDLSHGFRQQWVAGCGGPVIRSGERRHESGGTDSVPAGRLRHAIPFAAAWFNKRMIHHIELREFLEFQKGHAGPGWNEYRTIRNHIVDAFGKDPTRRLAFRDVASDVLVDAALVLKVYKFLDRWGIINRFDLDGVGYDPGNLERATRTGMASILSASKKPFSISEAMELWITGGRHSKTCLRPGTMQQYGVVPTGYIVPEAGKARFCASRPWVRCDGKHYESIVGSGGNGSGSGSGSGAGGTSGVSGVSGAGAGTGSISNAAINSRPLVLCVEAYKNGEFPPGTSSKDFVLRDGIPARPEDVIRSNNNTTANKKPFSPQEDLLLLEAIQKNWQKITVPGTNQVKPIYDWTAIANAVSGRNEAECVQRYLEYPIEESLLMKALDFDEGFPLLSLSEDGATSVPERYRRAPYNSTDLVNVKVDINPLVGNLATILYVIGPEVASDAARHALESVIAQLENPESGAGNPKSAGDIKMEEATEMTEEKTAETKATVPLAPATDGPNPMRFGVDIQVLRNASYEAISNAAVRAQELAHERMMSMYSIIMRMCDVQLERIWEKCDYLDTLIGGVGGEEGYLGGALKDAAAVAKSLGKP